MDFDFSQTYLYKIHLLTASLDGIFDKNLRTYANIGLSQFTLLLAVRHLKGTNQRTIARFLGITPAAVSRQIDIAAANHWIKIADVSRREQAITITQDGVSVIDSGITALDHHAFSIFNDENRQTSLMDHIETLQRNIDQRSNHADRTRSTG